MTVFSATRRDLHQAAGAAEPLGPTRPRVFTGNRIALPAGPNGYADVLS
jgi:hypothetical protein